MTFRSIKFSLQPFFSSLTLCYIFLIYARDYFTYILNFFLRYLKKQWSEKWNHKKIARKIYGFLTTWRYIIQQNVMLCHRIKKKAYLISLHNSYRWGDNNLINWMPFIYFVFFSTFFLYICVYFRDYKMKNTIKINFHSFHTRPT